MAKTSTKSSNPKVVDFSDLIKRGQEAADDDFGSGWRPPKNWRGGVKVARTNTKVKDDGLPRWGLWLEVTDEGEHKGKRFWTNLELNAAWDFINKRCVDAMAAFGVTAAFLQKNSRNPEAIGAALEAAEAIIIAGYRDNDKDPEKPWDAHKFEARKAKALARPVDDDEDEDEDYDEEEYEEEPEEEYEEEEPEEEEEEPEVKPARRRKPKSDPAYDPPPARTTRAKKTTDFDD